jgi:outer membrane PBP1 activator LpoA protein
VVSFLAESNDRTGSGALKYASVQVDEKQLQVMGADGWELVNAFLEMETAFPNFGSSEYVTGLQPNVRPQRAVLLFKRPAR